MTDAVTNLDITPLSCNTSDDQIYMSELRKPSEEAKRQGRIQTLYEKVLAEAQMRIQSCLNNGEYTEELVNSANVSAIAVEKVCNVKSCQVPSVTCGYISPYYAYNGTCNNRGSAPSRGAAATPLRRLTEGNETTTSSIPTHSVTLSSNMSHSKMILLWKQFIDHDLFLLPEMEGQCGSGYKRSMPALTLPSGTDRQQINDVTSYLDGSMIYGTSATQTTALRTMTDGKLKMGVNNSLPLDTSSIACPPENCSWYLAGDMRVNENNELTAMHTLWVREHNRVAAILHTHQRKWNEERLFQETRKVIVAMIQKITYEDYLPALLGQIAYNLILRGYKNYEPIIDSTIPNVYTTLDIPFSAGFYSDDEVDVDTELSQMLMALGTVNIPVDKVTQNIERQRDHATPTYGEWKNYCRYTYPLLPTSSIKSELVQSLRDTYGSVNDADLWAAAMAEETLPGALVGSTLACIIGKTFSDLRRGDRLFYSRPGAFTKSQRNEILKTSLSQVIQNHTDIESIQCNPFLDASGANMALCTSLKPFELKSWQKLRCFLSAQKDPATNRDIKLIMSVFGSNITLGKGQECYNAICSETLDLALYLWTTTPKYFNLQFQEKHCTLKRNDRLRRHQPCDSCAIPTSPTGPGLLQGDIILLRSPDQYVDRDYGLYSTRAGCMDGTIPAHKFVVPSTEAPGDHDCYFFYP